MGLDSSFCGGFLPFMQRDSAWLDAHARLSLVCGVITTGRVEHKLVLLESCALKLMLFGLRKLHVAT